MLRPDFLISLMSMSLVLRLPRELHLSRSSSNVPRLPSFLQLLQNPHIWSKVHNPLRLPRETTSELPKVVRDRQFLTLLTSKCASRHNGVQFFISHLARWLRTCRFGEPTFRPSGATNHWKNTVFRDFSMFSRTCIFFHFSSLIFSSLTLPTSAFPYVHIVGGLTSKLLSMNYMNVWSMFHSYVSLLGGRTYLPSTVLKRHNWKSKCCNGSITGGFPLPCLITKG